MKAPRGTPDPVPAVCGSGLRPTTLCTTDSTALRAASAPAMTDSGWRLPLLLFVAALVVRLAFLALEPRTRLVGDERTWVALAGSSRRLKSGSTRCAGTSSSILRPYFVAACSALPGGRTTVKVAESLLVLPAFAIGRRPFDRCVGLAAAGIAAFSLELVWQFLPFWSEPLLMARGPR